MEMLVLNVLDCSWISDLLGLSGGWRAVVGYNPRINFFNQKQNLNKGHNFIV